LLPTEFWARVQKTAGCWLWMGPQNGRGYGQWTRRTLSAHPKILVHRLVFESEVGPIPVGMEVCHRCDVRNCVRPEHLFAGTHAENMGQMNRAGRNPVKAGAAHRNARLTAADVAQIRARLSAGDSGRAVARDFGVSFQHVSDIKRGKKWAELVPAGAGR
jgi:hypothetical protein